MPAVSEKYGLAYYPVPKAASTSMKHVIHFLDSGDWLLEPDAPGKKLRSIHEVLPTGTPWTPKMWDRYKHLESFTIVRDPIKRFLSAYSNRVLYHGELNRWRVKNGSLTLKRTPRPSLEEFVEYLEDYQADSEPILHHTLPMRFFIGSDLSIYDHVFQVEELDKATDFLSDRTGLEIKLPHRQAGGPKLSPDLLSDRHLRKLRDYYAADYALLDAYFG